MAKFIINGKIKIGELRKFTKEIEAASEKDAKDKLYAIFGSNNKLKRSKIVIEKVSKI